MKRVHKDIIPVHRLSERSSSMVLLHRVDAESQPHIAKKITYAHRDDHYIFMYLEGGKSRFTVDFRDVELHAGCIFCILPGQVHRSVSGEDLTGWFMPVDTAMVDKKYRTFFEESLVAIQPLLINEQRAQALTNCANLLQAYIPKDNTPLPMPEIMHSLTSAYIGMIAEAYYEDQQACIASHGRPAAITREFRMLLARNYKVLKSPSQYAGAMNLSLSYLNEAVKQTTGQPVSYWIQYEAVLEAKRLLYYSELNVKEIAFTLGYEDHTYFSRLFSKMAGKSPGQFRKDHRE